MLLPQLIIPYLCLLPGMPAYACLPCPSSKHSLFVPAYSWVEVDIAHSSLCLLFSPPSAVCVST